MAFNPILSVEEVFGKIWRQIRADKPKYPTTLEEEEAMILMITPSAKTSATPLVDELTRKMTAAWRRRRTSEYAYRGIHICACGVNSDNRDHWVGDNLLTNSLCIHYLAFHRQDISQEELDKARSLPYGEESPTQEELHPPRAALS